MKLGTVVHEGKIYNLDYMTTEETEKLLKDVEAKRKMSFKQMSEIVKK